MIFSPQKTCILALAALIFQSLSAPKIQFDKTSFDAGTIIETQTKVITTKFTIKNIGDSVLKLEKVQPSCRCVSVRYDSLIQPGKTGSIESFIDTKGFHSGPMSKFIMVVSNAKNNTPVKLTIAGHFQATIDPSSNYLSFNTSTARIRDTLYLATKKKDLRILSVKFQSTDPDNDKSDWQAEMPIAMAINSLSMDSTRAADGYKVFGYELIAPSVKQSQEGWLIINTNHPDKPEVIIQGNILR